MARESAEGQAMELGWRRDNVTNVERGRLPRDGAEEDVLARDHPPHEGGRAHRQRRRRPDLDPFIRFGFLVGAAFQIQDDLLNLVGDEERYGKELSGDIYEGKRTLMLIRLLEQGTAEERERVYRLLRLPRAERSAAEVRWVRGAMDRYGCIEYARQVAHGLAGAALSEFAQILRGAPRLARQALHRGAAGVGDCEELSK